MAKIISIVTQFCSGHQHWIHTENWFDSTWVFHISYDAHVQIRRCEDLTEAGKKTKARIPFLL